MKTLFAATALHLLGVVLPSHAGEKPNIIVMLVDDMGFSADPSELNDLAENEPAMLEEFKELWQAWAKRCDVLK